MTNPATQFKKGNTFGKGAPKKEWTWTSLLKESLEEVDPGSGLEYRILVSKSLRRKAMEGDVVAIKEYGNRIEGMPKQAIEHSGTLQVKPLLGGTTSDIVPVDDSDQKAIEAPQES